MKKTIFAVELGRYDDGYFVWMYRTTNAGSLLCTSSHSYYQVSDSTRSRVARLLQRASQILVEPYVYALHIVGFYPFITHL